MNKTTLTKFSCMQLNFDLREHEILIKRHKNAGVKYFNDSNTFTECSNTVMTFMKILMITIQAEKQKSKSFLMT